jgi:hypothetical protein
MAIRAHELALGDFSARQNRAAALDQRADVVELLATGRVIPRHRRRMERASTIRARSLALEPVVPLGKRPTTLAHLRLPTLSVAGVVFAVVLTSALLAPCLASVTAVPEVELVEGLDQSAGAAALHRPSVETTADSHQEDMSASDMSVA